MFLVELFTFLFIERAARMRIRLRPCVGLLMLGLNQPRSQRGDVFFAEAGGSVAVRLDMRCFFMFFVQFIVQFIVRFFSTRSRLFGGFRYASFLVDYFTACSCFALRFCVRQDPVRQASREAPRHAGSRLHANRRT